MTGLRMQHIPYKGGGAAMTELMGGQIQANWSTVNAAAPHIKSGRLRGLAVSGESRVTALPDVPTFAEAGLPEYQERAWLGVFAPAGTPKLIIDKLSAEMAKILRSPGIKETFDKQGLVPLISTPEQFAEMLKKETATLTPIVNAANIKIEAK
jgi:tripartite-type tricarboxylate transporter receptor subunit TctC